MKNKSRLHSLRLAPRAAGFVLATVLPFAVNTASAFELNLGEVTGSLDTTVSYGTGWRMEDPDKNLAARYNGPNSNVAYLQLAQAKHATFANKNDGNANFDNNSRPITSVYKFTADLELKYQNFGVFVRGTGFYDTVIMGNNVNPASPNQLQNCFVQNGVVNLPSCGFDKQVSDHSGNDLRFLDSYVYGNFDVGGMPLNVRAGAQVINWGEALFLQDGINSANPVSLSKLRLPGAEIKEALLPLQTLYASLGLTDNLTAEAFYQFDWDYSEADDRGTYYSTDDAFAGLGSNHILVRVPTGAPFPNDGAFVTLDRTTDQPVDGKGQFGLAFRYSMDATEFGFFFMNYHSHKPVAQAKTGPTYATLLPATQYQLVYPEDIQMYGLSFSTTVGDLSFSGELAYRPNDVILAELGDNLVAYESIYAAAMQNSGGAASPFVATGGTYGSILNGGNKILPGQTIQDSAELATYNLALVGIYNFGPSLGADGMTGALEFGASYIPDGEDERYASTASLLNIPYADIVAAYGPGLAAGICGALPDTEVGTCISEGPSNDYLDRLSMGYRLVLTSTYNDVFAGVALTPSVRFAHDFKGNSHRTGNFLENRKAGTLGLSALYNQALEVAVAYNAFWGADLSNLLTDRDNITATVKYSF